MKIFRMFKKRNTYNCSLNIGPIVVYIGVTQYPELDEARYRYNGVRFTHMNVDEKARTYDEAVREAEERLKQHQEENNGEKPRYNKDPNSRVEELNLSVATT